MNFIKKPLQDEKGAILILAAPMILCIIVVILGFVDLAYGWRQKNRIDIIAYNASVAACSHLPWEHYDPGGNTPLEMAEYIASTHSDLINGPIDIYVSNQSTNQITVTAQAQSLWINNLFSNGVTGIVQSSYTTQRTLNHYDPYGRPVYEYRTQANLN